jgi:hypothetical protein
MRPSFWHTCRSPNSKHVPYNPKSGKEEEEEAASGILADVYGKRLMPIRNIEIDKVE